MKIEGSAVSNSRKQREAIALEDLYSYSGKLLRYMEANFPTLLTRKDAEIVSLQDAMQLQQALIVQAMRIRDGDNSADTKKAIGNFAANTSDFLEIWFQHVATHELLQKREKEKHENIANQTSRNLQLLDGWKKIESVLNDLITGKFPPDKFQTCKKRILMLDQYMTNPQQPMSNSTWRADFEAVSDAVKFFSTTARIREAVSPGHQEELSHFAIAVSRHILFLQEKLLLGQERLEKEFHLLLSHRQLIGKQLGIATELNQKLPNKIEREISSQIVKLDAHAQTWHRMTRVELEPLAEISRSSKEEQTQELLWLRLRSIANLMPPPEASQKDIFNQLNINRKVPDEKLAVTWTLMQLAGVAQQCGSSRNERKNLVVLLKKTRAELDSENESQGEPSISATVASNAENLSKRIKICEARIAYEDAKQIFLEAREKTLFKMLDSLAPLPKGNVEKPGPWEHLLHQYEMDKKHAGVDGDVPHRFPQSWEKLEQLQKDLISGNEQSISKIKKTKKTEPRKRVQFVIADPQSASQKASVKGGNVKEKKAASTTPDPPSTSESYLANELLTRKYEIGIGAGIGNREGYLQRFQYFIRKAASKISIASNTVTVQSTSPSVELFLTSAIRDEIVRWLQTEMKNPMINNFSAEPVPDTRTHVKGSNVITVNLTGNAALFFYDPIKKLVIVAPEERFAHSGRNLDGINKERNSGKKIKSFYIPDKAQQTLPSVSNKTSIKGP